ncbi:hypothetical protein STIUS_v1c05210 [Spiroplasma sp. TIUS-1]|uniref:glucose PTS transporter subunit IIA n=1 Tax=Spiroplasma sp. TIUS-1 TaxID=216963 RepID=UPI0013973880|nr:glucose PTS transporter subunit IIA [Spiroplasma sp. TIUS-1]QHX36075.1 hypothetical protein STIUS_v1c05210 [Spiroplasma sp. TIUS-1]
MNKIKILAPVSGKVLDITKCSDKTFAEKMLGDGIIIIPDSEEYFSPLNDAKIEMIADTKHAYYFSSNNINLLMHIGLETVSLNGKPFDVKVKVGQTVNTHTHIANLNLKLLDAKKISAETPIVIDTTELKSFKFLNKNISDHVNQGDLLFEFEYEFVSSNEKAKATDNSNEKRIKIQKEMGKYEKIANDILKLVGRTNQKSVYNCMTRLRMKIVDKDKVDSEGLKKLNIVKGINWNGDEIQIIIGGEVNKIKLECDKILSGKEDSFNKDQSLLRTKKIPFKNKILPAIAGIIIPALPIILGTGLLAGLQATLVQTGLLKNPGQVGYGTWDVLFYTLAKVGLELVGFVFLYNTIKYLGGDPIMGLFLALLLTSRHLQVLDWTLFKLFDNPVKVKSYEGTVIPMISAGFLLFYLDRWVKSWMPTSVDIVVRPASVMLISFMIMIFTIGPALGIVEQLLSEFIQLLEKIPFGIGAGLFAFLWQPLVLSGTHVAIVTALGQEMINGHPSTMYAVTQLAVMAQIGTVIAVGIRTKNLQIKSTAFGAIPGSIFGVTEPIIYGINLPKVWPFLQACTAAGIVGIIAGIIGVEQTTRTGTGVLSYMGFATTTQTLLAVGLGFATLALAFAITFVLYKDRKTEKTSIKKANDLLIKAFVMQTQKDRNSSEVTELKSRLNDIYENIKSNENYKKYENAVIKLQRVEMQKQQIIAKNDLKKETLFKKAMNHYDNVDKYNIYANKYLKLNIDEKVEILDKEIKLLSLELEAIKEIYLEQNMKDMKLIENILEKVSSETNLSNLKDIKPLYQNGLYAVDLSYELIDKKEFEYKNKDFVLNKKLGG